MSPEVSLDPEKFIEARIMELVDPNNPKNFKFSSEFESTVEAKLSDYTDIKDTFRNVALMFASKSGIELTDVEIDYATDLYVGINPWRKASGRLP